MRKRAAPRLLARGNREIFVEIAGQFATFIATFSGATARDDRRWQQYRETIVPSAATELFPAANIDLLRDGMESYYDAMFETDMRRQAELVLRGNILLADYEQQRVDPIVRSAVELVPEPPAGRRRRRGTAAGGARQEAVGAHRHRRRVQRDRPDVFVDRDEVAHGDRPAGRRVPATAERTDPGRLGVAPAARERTALPVTLEHAARSRARSRSGRSTTAREVRTAARARRTGRASVTA